MKSVKPFQGQKLKENVMNQNIKSFQPGLSNVTISTDRCFEERITVSKFCVNRHSVLKNEFKIYIS